MSTAIPETFKELCQHAVRESGMATGGTELPATVTGQTNALSKMVSRVAEAWVEIQGEKKWNFLRKTFEFALQVGVRTYDITGTDPGDLNWQDLDVLEEKGIFVLTDAVTGTKARLTYVDWDTWRQAFALTSEWPSSAPTRFTISPDDELILDTLPIAADTVSLPYWAQPQVLAEDGDEPSIDIKLRRVISWRAARKFAEDKNDSNRVTRCSAEESKLYHGLMRKYLPPVTVGAEPIT